MSRTDQGRGFWVARWSLELGNGHRELRRTFKEMAAGGAIGANRTQSRRPLRRVVRNPTTAQGIHIRQPLSAVESGVRVVWP